MLCLESATPQHTTVLKVAPNKGSVKGESDFGGSVIPHSGQTEGRTDTRSLFQYASLGYTPDMEACSRHTTHGKVSGGYFLVYPISLS
jgi:hypothetical protein